MWREKEIVARCLNLEISLELSLVMGFLAGSYEGSISFEPGGVTVVNCIEDDYRVWIDGDN
jgi:hypothetical protein